MPVVGLTSLSDKWNGFVTLSFNATGFSTTSTQNDNGYEEGVSYLSVKMNAQLPSVSESVGISGFTAHYLRMSDAKKFSPEYHVLQYIRFYLGDPERQGEFVCVAEFDFT